MSKSSLKEDVSSHAPVNGKRTLLVRAPGLSEYGIGVKLLQKARCCKPHVVWVSAKSAHLNPICMASLMLAKLLPTTKAIWTKVDAVPRDTHGICTLDPNGMGKISQTPVTLRLHAGFIDSCRDEGK